MENERICPATTLTRESVVAEYYENTTAIGVVSSEYSLEVKYTHSVQCECCLSYSRLWPYCQNDDYVLT